MPDAQAANPAPGAAPLDAPPLRSNETHEPARETIAERLKQRRAANQEPQSPPSEAKPEPVADEQPKTDDPAETPDQPDDGTVELAADLPGLASQLGIEEQHLLGLKVTRKINGEDRTFTLADALQGQMFEGDYRRKTAEVAEQKRQMDAAVQQIAEHWKTRLETLDQHIMALETRQGAKPDPQLAASDPAAYVAQLAAWNQQQDLIQAAKATRDAERQRGSQEQQAQLHHWRTEQIRQAREKIPELADPATADKFRGQMYSLAPQWGFSGDDITQWLNGGFDHRHMMVLADAIRFRNGQATLDKAKLKELPKVRIKPVGTLGRASPQKVVDQAIARMKGLPSRSQERRDATREVFKNLISKGKR